VSAIDYATPAAALSAAIVANGDPCGLLTLLNALNDVGSRYTAERAASTDNGDPIPGSYVGNPYIPADSPTPYAFFYGGLPTKLESLTLPMRPPDLLGRIIDMANYATTNVASWPQWAALSAAGQPIPGLVVGAPWMSL
jgi:hypothetical protein